MRILYDIFFMLFGLFYLPCLVLKGKAHGRFLERFGAFGRSMDGLDAPVWIHAVSVGEANVAARIAKGIRKRSPGVPIVVSTTTTTGQDMMEKAGKGVVDRVFYYPLDISFIVSRVISKINPRLYVVIETELWPNLMTALKRKGVPIAVVNGRISDRSFRNYLKVKPFISGMLGCIDVFSVQTKDDASRIVRMGAATERVTVTGNVKFDQGISEGLPLPVRPEDIGMRQDDLIIVAGSTHFNEESQLIDVYKRLSGRIPGLKLIIAPRHVERAEAVKVYIEEAGLRHMAYSGLRGKGAPGGGKTGTYDVMVVDSIGHLKDMYALATIVFVGGSLVKKGGQNIIEPASYGKPVVFGPNMYNFKEAVRMFLSREGAIQVADADELEQVLERLIKDDGMRRNISRKAVDVIRENSGAVDRTVSLLDRFLG